ncbi:MAG: thiamine pyrophosphate-dependent enzyme [Desulfatirhabdiaceae bacterium]
MTSLINTSRPPVFCPGCSHERITLALDKTFQNMNIAGHEIALVSDIGCSGLFDTFFNTHAFHGLHGRALTYAAGIKMSRPDLHVIVTMGDGGLGIGGAHLLSACRRNLNMTLLILNNFNFGMTGGQFSATTPPEASVGSGFLNQLERPLDACQVASAAGAAFVARASSYQKDLVDLLEQAIRFDGFSIVDMWGVCPGRYTKKNKITPASIGESLAGLPPMTGVVEANMRQEYGAHYRQISSGLKPARTPKGVAVNFKPLFNNRREVILLGSAGQRIITAGEIICLAGMSAGLNATQKNEYNITVLRGPSISDLVLSSDPIGYTGIEHPSVVVAIAQEGIDRRKGLFAKLGPESMILAVKGLVLPDSPAKVHEIDMKALGLKSQDYAMAAVSILAGMNLILNADMLKQALEYRFRGSALEASLTVMNQCLTTS